MQKPLDDGFQNRRNLFAGVILAIPLLLFLPQYQNFAFPPHSSYSDLLISHLPNLVYLKSALFQSHELPLWSPMILSGNPFAADPLSGIWYLPTWISMLFPQPAGITLMIFAHIFMGGIGLYFFLMRCGCNFYGAIAGALSFVMMPKIWAHFGAGHVSLIYAISWTPWLILAESRAIEKQKYLDSLFPGIIWGAIILADVRWAFYSGLLWGGYSLYETLKMEKSSRNINGEERTLRLLDFVEWIKRLIIKMVAGLGISAPLLVPLFEFTRLSTRKSMNLDDVLTLSLPTNHLLGLGIPDFAGYFEWILYPGVILFLAFILMAVNRVTRREQWFWMIVILFSMMMALGKNGWIASELIRILPGQSLLRVPSRFLFLAGVSFSILVGFFVHDFYYKGLLTGKWSRLIVFFWATFSGTLAAGIFILTKEPPIQFLWSFGIASGLMVILIFAENKWTPNTLHSQAIILLIVIDLGTVDFTLVRFLKASELVNREDSIDAAQYLNNQTGIFRTYSPSYSLPQDLAAVYGLELADGIDPLQIRSYAEFFQSASGVPQEGYSVTQPSFHSGNPITDNLGYKPNAKLLGMLNVRFVISAFDLDVEGLLYKTTFGSIRIYENEFFYPRLWMDAPYTQIKSSPPIELENKTANFLQAEVEGPGTLIFSEISYPGWVATLDGNRTELRTSYSLFRSVIVPEGIHTVQLSYRPFSVLVGVATAFITWFVICILSINYRSKRG